MGMKSKIKMLALLGLIFLGGAAFYWYAKGVNIPVLEPRGMIAQKERNLIIIAVMLSLIVVIPVYIMLIVFPLKYREGNKKAVYRPDFEHSRLLESIWWGVPLAIILVLGIITFYSSRDLDPFKKINPNQPEVKIQVVALQWKWLFLYPQQNAASVNIVHMPVNTPVDFEITADAPMNSFWIPQLGGQIYAMSGMATQLHLIASQNGLYRGSSANISGEGFADMHFDAVVESGAGFKNWAQKAASSSNKFDLIAYNQLAKPSNNMAPASFRLADPSLFHFVISKYEAPIYFKGEGANL
jgi:cytochrome o ubiquinol oxidase subunit 2